MCKEQYNTTSTITHKTSLCTNDGNVSNYYMVSLSQVRIKGAHWHASPYFPEVNDFTL